MKTNKKDNHVIKNLKLLLYIILLTHVNELKGQINEAEFQGNFSEYIIKSLYEEGLKNYFFFDGCENGCSFIRFRIDTVGNVIDIKSSYGTNENISNLLKRLLLKTNGKWIPSQNNDKVVEQSQFFILPVIYFLSCKEDKKTNDKILINLTSIISFDDAPDISRNGINSKTKQFDCILLSPIYLYGPQY